MVIFRENTEDIYAGLEVEEGTPEAKRLIEILKERVRLGHPRRLRHRHQADLRDGLEATDPRRDQVRGREAAARASRSCTRATSRSSPRARSATGATSSTRDEFADVAVGWDDCGGKPGDKVLVKDNIADITLQQVLTRPAEFDVIATTNLNGDYLSDALAAQVGGIGIAPGGNINYVTGHGIFEATHGTAPKYAGQDKVNPSSVLLSGVMMFEHLGWTEAAADIERAIEATIADKIVTYDFARLMEGATEVKTSEFARGHRRPPLNGIGPFGRRSGPSLLRNVRECSSTPPSGRATSSSPTARPLHIRAMPPGRRAAPRSRCTSA